MEEALLRPSDLVGKTIAETNGSDWDDWFGMRFTDGTYAVLLARTSYESTELSLAQGANYQLRAIGVISAEELTMRNEAEKQRFELAAIERERAQYLRLAEKFKNL